MYAKRAVGHRSAMKDIYYKRASPLPSPPPCAHLCGIFELALTSFYF